jgi:2-polyprenyl-3-methyl-5-hydroxy-6-metoxy-1,4-benzoquinol methylase
MDIEHYSQTSRHYYDASIPPMLDSYLRSSDYQTLLDSGCGDGSLLFALKQGKFLQGKSVYAVDLSENRIQLVRQIDDAIVATVDNAETLRSVPDGSIDFFISTQVIEHINDSRFIATMARVVRANGIVYLTTVYKKWFGWYFYRSNRKWALDPTHLREYRSDDELFRHVSADEFQILESRKTLLWFPLMDFFIRKLDVKNRQLYQNAFASFLRKIKIPIIGYYLWEIVLQRK